MATGKPESIPNELNAQDINFIIQALKQTEQSLARAMKKAREEQREGLANAIEGEITKMVNLQVKFMNWKL